MDKKGYASPGRKEKGKSYELIFMLVNLAYLYHLYLETQGKDKNSDFLLSISLQPNVVDLSFFKI